MFIAVCRHVYCSPKRSRPSTSSNTVILLPPHPNHHIRIRRHRAPKRHMLRPPFQRLDLILQRHIRQQKLQLISCKKIARGSYASRAQTTGTSVRYPPRSYLRLFVCRPASSSLPLPESAESGAVQRWLGRSSCWGRSGWGRQARR
jgi:hypothetical protein